MRRRMRRAREDCSVLLMRLKVGMTLMGRVGHMGSPILERVGGWSVHSTYLVHRHLQQLCRTTCIAAKSATAAVGASTGECEDCRHCRLAVS